jgi:endonuclease/exonuclease/phosphatase family metal-dependent hydrolase
MNFLFWNARQESLSRQVRDLADEHGSDFVILAEAADNAAGYLIALNDQRHTRHFHLVKPLLREESRLLIFSRLPAGEIVWAGNDGTCAVLRVQPAGLPEFILASVHLPSGMHYTEADRAANAQETARLIADIEASAGHSRTVVMGDFNMNPFEQGMVISNGFHAILDRQVAAKGQRIVQKKAHPFFYNPTWRFMNDEGRQHAGSFYYTKAVPHCHFWNTFDQVLLRPDLLPFFNDSGLKLVTEIAGKSLLDGKGRPSKLHSDHLPLHLTLSL